MKKEVTEYEPAEDTITKVKCGSCEQTWDTRGVRGEQGVNTVVLDAKIQKRLHYGQDMWREVRLNKWNDHSLTSRNPYRISGAEIEDYCHSCWDGFFTQGPAAKIEETDYYIEEETRSEYYCDFCGSEMGEESDHEVTLNPRFEVEQNLHTNRGLPEQKTTVETREIGETASRGLSDIMYAKRDDSFDCCRNCANEIFDLDSLQVGESYGGIIHATVVATKNMCIQLKDFLLFNRV